MLPTTPDSVLPFVMQSMANASNPRVGMLIESLVKHLHAFVLETRLTEAEFEYALGFINAIGQATSATKNEAVLVADLLGVSSVVALLNNADAHGESDAALLGPFWRAGSANMQPGASIAAAGTPGVPLEAGGLVQDKQGQPLAGVTVDVWHASPSGLYENQDEAQPDMNLRGRFLTNDQGRFFFRSVRPAGYPVPVDGPGGILLRAQGRHEFRPAHLHFMLSKPGFKVLTTQVYADDSEQLHSDPTFGVTQRLVGKFNLDARPSGDVALFDHTFTLLEGEMVFPLPPIP